MQVAARSTVTGAGMGGQKAKALNPRAERGVAARAAEEQCSVCSEYSSARASASSSNYLGFCSVLLSSHLCPTSSPVPLLSSPLLFCRPLPLFCAAMLAQRTMAPGSKRKPSHSLPPDPKKKRLSPAALEHPFTAPHAIVNAAFMVRSLTDVFGVSGFSRFLYVFTLSRRMR